MNANRLCKMKITSLLASTALLAAMLSVSCSDDVSYDYGFDTTTTEITFQMHEETVYFTVNTTAPDWTAVSDQPWIRPQINGSNVTVTVSENESGSTRSGNVILRAKGAPDYIVVIIQTAVEGNYLIVNTNNWVLGGDSGTHFFNVDSNTTWEVTDDSQASWMTAQKEDNTVRIYADDNFTSESRTANIVISSTEANRTINVTVTQEVSTTFVFVKASLIYEIYEPSNYDGGMVVDENKYLFGLTLIDATSTQLIDIDGIMPKPENPLLPLPEGIYTVSTKPSGELMSIMSGKVADTFWTMGTTWFMNYEDEDEIGDSDDILLVTSGTMEVSRDETTGDYSVRFNFGGQLADPGVGHWPTREVSGYKGRFDGIIE